MKIHKFFIIIILFFGYNIAFGQKIEDYSSTGRNTISNNSEYPSFKDRLFFGGGFGISIGNQSVLIDVSPIIGVKINEIFNAGIGFTYKYYRINDYVYNDLNMTSNIYGGSIFLRANIYKGLYAKGEIEQLLVNTKFSKPEFPSEKDNFTSIFVGGGYLSRISDHTSAYVEVLFNLNNTFNSPYTNPVIRFGIVYGL